MFDLGASFGYYAITIATILQGDCHVYAFEPKTGKLKWYYQTTPRDSWDYDSVQKLILAELPVDGAPRPVIMQANKNGFFYVLDRKTGKLLSLGEEQ